MNEALIVFSPGGFIEFINNSASQLLGYSRGELIGRPIKYLIPPEKPWGEFNKEVLGGLSQGRSISNLETILLTKNKEEIPVSFSASPIQGPHEEPIAIVAIANDISETKNLIRRLEKITEDLKAAKYQLERKIGEIIKM